MLKNKISCLFVCILHTIGLNLQQHFGISIFYEINSGLAASCANPYFLCNNSTLLLQVALYPFHLSQFGIITCPMLIDWSY